MKVPVLLSPRRRKLLLRLIFNGAAQAGVAAWVAWSIQHIFDGVLRHGQQGAALSLYWIGAGLLASALALFWLRRTEHVDAERLGQDYTNEIRLSLFDRMRHSNLRDFQRRGRGATMLRFIGDLNSLRRWVSLGLARLTVGGVSAVGAIIVLTILSWRLALAAGLVLSAGVAVLLVMGRKMQAAVVEARRRRSRLATNVSEKITSLAVLQVFGRSDDERKRVAKQSGRLRDAMVDQARVAGVLRGISDSVTAVASFTVLLVGAFQVLAGLTTPGTVVAAIGIVGLLTPSLRDLGRVYEYWQTAQVAQQKILNFLTLPLLDASDSELPPLLPGPGQLTFCDASIDGALHQFSAEIDAGQQIAIVGPNGAGKSSLLCAVARLINLDEGHIFLDGQDIALHDSESVHRVISMLSPDLPLMRGTLQQNLIYRAPKADKEHIEQIVYLCGIDELFRELPKGLDTRVTEAGLNLSPGQRQRIALARALMGNPVILLLDEADENLDPQASRILDQVLEQRRGTTVVITHRLERARKADLIWYIAEGRLLEAGRPDELLGTDSYTSRLFRAAHAKVS